MLKAILKRLPRFDIAINDDVYLRRYKLIQTRWFNLYLHEILRSDADRCLHDHPWAFVTFIISGGYLEHTPIGSFWRSPWRVYYRPARWVHRLELKRPAWTLVLTSHRQRAWGFFTDHGWRPFKPGDNPVCETEKYVYAAPELAPQPSNTLF